MLASFFYFMDQRWAALVFQLAGKIPLLIDDILERLGAFDIWFVDINI
jgi:hypothetical protein